MESIFINREYGYYMDTIEWGIAQAGLLAALNAASHQHSMNLISQAFLAEDMPSDITEAVGSKKIAEADLARNILHKIYLDYAQDLLRL